MGDIMLLWLPMVLYFQILPSITAYGCLERKTQEVGVRLRSLGSEKSGSFQSLPSPVDQKIGNKTMDFACK